MEALARNFSEQVEQVYANRCSPSTFSMCQDSNYAECSSVSSNPECFPFGSGERLEDTTISAVRIPEILQTGPDGNPTDSKTIESVCYSAALDSYFNATYESDSMFWQGLDSPPPQLYFGSESGAFRIYPARFTKCDDYDPRVRPWYNAASSGPKNLILILDVSGSMASKGRISKLKAAAKVMVNALTITDRIAVFPFSGTSQVIADEDVDGGHIFFEASASNKKKIVSKIERLKARGGTNFVDPFDKAVDVFERSHRLELATDCTTAVVFLTDGMTTNPGSAFSWITGQLASMEQTAENPLFVFTYSVDTANEFPKRLACSVENGVWSSIGETDDIFDSLIGYNKLFALGLGDEQNKGFTAWTEPYKFSSGIMGVTVASPVYDRTKSPPLLIGVVGVDNTLETFNRLLVAEGESQDFLTKIAERSAAQCPRLRDLDVCLLESYRRQGRAGEKALCKTTSTSNCTFVEIEEESCQNILDYPRSILVQSDARHRKMLMNMCTTGLGKGVKFAIGFTVPIVVLLLCVVVRVVWRRKHSKE